LQTRAAALQTRVQPIWYDPFEHLLDYTSGEVTCARDQPATLDGNGLHEAQDVVEYRAVDWSKNGNCHDPTHLAGAGLGLPVEWYRGDVLRSKLVSLQLPRRLNERTEPKSEWSCVCVCRRLQCKPFSEPPRQRPV